MSRLASEGVRLIGSPCASREPDQRTAIYASVSGEFNGLRRHFRPFATGGWRCETGAIMRQKLSVPPFDPFAAANGEAPDRSGPSREPVKVAHF